MCKTVISGSASHNCNFSIIKNSDDVLARDKYIIRNRTERGGGL